MDPSIENRIVARIVISRHPHADYWHLDGKYAWDRSSSLFRILDQTFTNTVQIANQTRLSQAGNFPLSTLKPKDGRCDCTCTHIKWIDEFFNGAQKAAKRLV